MRAPERRIDDAAHLLARAVRDDSNGLQMIAVLHKRLCRSAIADTLDPHLGAKATETMSNPRFRLHVVTNRGRRRLTRESQIKTLLGYAAAFAANVANRSALARLLERAVFSDPREALPVSIDDYRTKIVALTAQNLSMSVLTSCSIPFWLNAVHDIPGAPLGAYWDGGITDYHLYLDYARIVGGPERNLEGDLVLYPHFRDCEHRSSAVARPSASDT